MNRRDFSLLTKMISGKAGVSIQLLPAGYPPEWKADPIKKVIWYPSQYFYSDEDFGIAIHECGHIRFSGLSKITQEDLDKFIKSQKEIGIGDFWQLVNALEDIRIEALMSKVYLGARYYFRHTALKYFATVKYREAESSLDRHYCLYFIYKYGLGEDYLKAMGLDNPKLITAIENTEAIVPELFDCKSSDEVV